MNYIPVSKKLRSIHRQILSARKTKHLIVDAEGLVFRADAVMKEIDRSISYGVLYFLLALIKQFKPDKLSLVWDSSTDLTEIYPDYRKDRTIGREKDPKDYEFALELLSLLGVRQYKKEGFEADRIIAALINNKPENEDIILYSDDKDFFQLMENGVKIFSPRKDNYITEGYVKNKFGVKPEDIGKFLALAGDPVDRIPSIYNKDETLETLKKYDKIKNIPDAPKQLFTNYKLTNLKDIDEIPKSMSNESNKNFNEFIEKIKKAKFDTLLKRLDELKNLSELS